MTLAPAATFKVQEWGVQTNSSQHYFLVVSFFAHVLCLTKHVPDRKKKIEAIGNAAPTQSNSFDCTSYKRQKGEREGGRVCVCAAMLYTLEINFTHTTQTATSRPAFQLGNFGTKKILTWIQKRRTQSSRSSIIEYTRYASTWPCHRDHRQ